jgi:hypothetical protein
MNKIVIVLLALGLINSVIAENPGLVGGLKLPIINKIKEKYFETFMDGFRNINIDDLHEGDLKVTGIEVEAINDDHNNVQVSFNEEKNGINVVVDNTQIKVHCNWGYKVLIITISGVGDIRGPISHLSMLIGFETQEKDGAIIPKINIQDFDIGIDSGAWDFHFDCSACPPGIADLLLNLFKGELVGKIKDEARNVVNTQIADMVNNVLLESYPLQAAVTDTISLSTATTSVVKVKANYLSVPLDATIFLTEEGYARQFEAPEIPFESESNPGELMFFASTYLFDTFESTINKTPFDIPLSIMGYDASFKIDGTKVPLELKTQNKNLHASLGGIFELPAWKFEAEVGIETNIDLFFPNGDEANMVYVDADVNKDSLKFTKFKISFYGWNFNLSFVTGIVNFLIGNVINLFVLPSIPVAKIEALPLTSTGSQVNFFETYTELGLAFNFGLDH